jgi:hypothetical protein
VIFLTLKYALSWTRADSSIDSKLDKTAKRIPESNVALTNVTMPTPGPSNPAMSSGVLGMSTYFWHTC